MQTLRGSVVLVMALGCAASMTVPAVASGAHVAAGAKYSGNSGQCAPSIHKQCVFKFRVSNTGHKLRYVKKGKAISSWACQGGGGEAIFGSGTNEDKVPTARIHADGTFSGSDGAGSQRVTITGKFSKSGKSATLKFKSPGHCHTPLLTLHKR
jgi:hypothetical protein